jgi:tetratricopeptide (TPR) repeat protein
MPLVTPLYVALGVWLASAGGGWGQNPFDDRLMPSPECLRPRQQRDHLAAVHQYAIGLKCERSHRLPEALKSFEEAVRLDPEAVSPRKALIPLYLALSRDAEALAACRQVLDLDPEDHETWCLCARLLKAQGKVPEALKALGQAVACPGLKDEPELFAEIAFDLGRMYEEEQDYPRAAATIQEAIAVLTRSNSEISPAALYEGLGRIYSAAGRLPQAIDAFLKARAAFQEQDPLAACRLDYQLATAYAAQGKPADALRRLDNYLPTQPPGTEPYEFKVRLLKQLGKEREIAQSLRDAAERDPNNVALQLFLARHYLEEKRSAEAERLYSKLAADSPSADVYRGLFTLYRAEERMGEALNLLDRSIAAGADHPQQAGDPAARIKARAMIAALQDEPALAKALVPAARARLEEPPALRPETRRFVALVAERARQLDAAEELYRSCFSGPLSPQNEAALYQGLLQVLWAAGKHEAVAATCRKALPSSRGAFRLLLHSNLARALGVMGKTDEALADVDQGANLGEETRLHFRLLRAEILQRARRFDQAETECQALLREDLSPDDARRVRYVLSGVYSAAHAYPKAEEQLRLILQGDPDNASACNDLGYLMADQGKDLEQAEQLIRKAIKLDQEQKRSAPSAGDEEDAGPNAAYLDSLGWVLYRRGRLAEARREMKKAVALREGAADPVVWDHLADVYFRLGDTTRAGRAWRKAVTLFESDKRRQLDDQYEEVKRKLQRLESEPHH